MFSWTQIIVVIIAVLACCITVAICDITIIKEIKKFRKTIRKFLALLVEENEED